PSDYSNDVWNPSIYGRANAPDSPSRTGACSARPFDFALADADCAGDPLVQSGDSFCGESASPGMRNRRGWSRFKEIHERRTRALWPNDSAGPCEFEGRANFARAGHG